MVFLSLFFNYFSYLCTSKFCAADCPSQPHGYGTLPREDILSSWMWRIMIYEPKKWYKQSNVLCVQLVYFVFWLDILLWNHFLLWQSHVGGTLGIDYWTVTTKSGFVQEILTSWYKVFFNKSDSIIKTWTRDQMQNQDLKLMGLVF